MNQSDFRTIADANPLMLALEAWQFISFRTRYCLERYAGSDPAKTIAWVPIGEMRLAHLTRWTTRDLLSLPGCGRASLCEIAIVMERYGFRLKGDDGPGPAESRTSLDVASMVPTITKRMETQREAMDRKLAIVRLKDEGGLTTKEIARIYGISSGRVQEIVKQTYSIAMQRERYPLNGVMHA